MKDLQNIAIIGGGGAIGTAFTQTLAARYSHAIIHVFSSHPIPHSSPNVTSEFVNYDQENSLHDAAQLAARHLPLDLILVTTGRLHLPDIRPEKTFRSITAENMQALFTANTILPALIAKHFIPKMHGNRRSVFAALSARVGSISDNRLGGWYSYRASKAALNMVLKCAAIETARRNKNAIIVGLHPGTVDSPLSRPFQRSVPDGQLFTPTFAVENILSVLDNLGIEDSGACFAWDGREILP